jgi:methyl halide transferase
MTTLNEQYWNERYATKSTGWDLGAVSPPLKAYIDQLTDKNLRILIPGCGNTYEAAYLLQQGFTNITVLDIAPLLVAELQQQFANEPHLKVVEGDFFTHQGEYDLILEQTFFCAIDPGLRPAYAQQMHQLLAPGGKLVGVLFNREFEAAGPPFGGNAEEYKAYFTPYFETLVLEPCYNSIQPRAGNELFVVLQSVGIG